MNINIKNCEVNIIKGTDTLEISGNARPAESKESGCISEMTYSMAAFMANRDKVRIGDNPLEYFKAGRNRIAFDFGEEYSRYYWLSTLYDEEASAAYFCDAAYRGTSSTTNASIVYIYVRPRFIIHKS